MLNANEKTNQIQTEVAIGLDGKMGVASSGEKSFNGGSRAETNCDRMRNRWKIRTWRHSVQTTLGTLTEKKIRVRKPWLEGNR